MKIHQHQETLVKRVKNGKNEDVCLSREGSRLPLSFFFSNNFLFKSLQLQLELLELAKGKSINTEKLNFLLSSAWGAATVTRAQSIGRKNCDRLRAWWGGLSFARGAPISDFQKKLGICPNQGWSKFSQNFPKHYFVKKCIAQKA